MDSSNQNLAVVSASGNLPENRAYPIIGAGRGCGPTLLTIAIPTFNRVNDLAICMDSVCAAWRPEMAGQVELVISSNASSDGTHELIQRWHHPGFSVRYYQWSENVGGVANVLKVAELCESKFCWLLADDDVLETNALERVLAILSDNPDCGGLTIGYSAWNADLTKCVNRPNLAGGKDLVFHSDPSAVWRHCLHEWGFLSVCIVNSRIWKESLARIPIKEAGFYPHLWIQCDMACHSASWCYSGAHLVRWRMDRDSALRDQGALSRALMPLETYGKLASFFQKTEPNLSAQALSLCCSCARHYMRRFKTDWNDGCFFTPRAVYILMGKCISHSGWKSPAFYYDTLPTFLLPAGVGKMLRYLKSKYNRKGAAPAKASA